MKKSHLDNLCSQRMAHSRMCRQAFLGLVAVLAFLFYSGISGAILASDSAEVDATGKVLTTASVLIPGTISGMVPREAEPGGGGGGGGNPDDDPDDPVAAKILKKIAENKADFAKIEKSVGEIPELKKEAEELHKAIKNFDGLENTVNELVAKAQKFDNKLRNVRREVSGDPLRRITTDPEMRAALVATIKVPYLKKHNRDSEISEEMQKSYEQISSIGTPRAISGGASPGSNYIDDELLPAIYQLVGQYGVHDNFEVSRPSKRTEKLIVDTSDPDFLFEDEGGIGSERSYTGSQVSSTLKKAGGWIGVSNEMLEDDEVGFVNHLMKKFLRQMARRADHMCIAADGTDDGADGEFNGIFDAGTAYVAASGNTSIGTIDYADIIGLLAGADEAIAGTGNSKWFMHPQVLIQLLNIKDSNGRPIFLTALEAPTEGAFGSILGYPIIRSLVAPKVDGTSKAIAAWGDCEAMHVAIGRDFEFASSSDALFTSDKTAFRARARMAGKLRAAAAFEVLTTAAS